MWPFKSIASLRNKRLTRELKMDSLKIWSCCFCYLSTLLRFVCVMEVNEPKCNKRRNNLQDQLPYFSIVIALCAPCFLQCPSSHDPEEAHDQFKWLLSWAAVVNFAQQPKWKANIIAAHLQRCRLLSLNVSGCSLSPLAFCCLADSAHPN